jgi:16S rRNA (uracil1498-N3)-methyltransferase
MKLHRFYIPQTLGDSEVFKLDHAPLVEQITKVLKLHIGETIILFDGSGHDYQMRIEGREADILKLALVKKTINSVKPVRDVYLFASIVKKDTFEWIVEKATELGIAQVIPVISTRSEKKNLNVERLWKIMVEASEQSGRGTLPTIVSIMDLDQALDYLKTLPNVSPIVFHIESEPYKNDLHTIVSNPIAVFIGPEGGWTVEEIAKFKEKGIPVYSLGPQILRAETAVISALTKVIF